MTGHIHDNLFEAEYPNDNTLNQGYIDIHCHCLPGLDDGPVTVSESLALCQALNNDGITTVIATPHQLGRFSGYNEAMQVREAVSSLNEKLRDNEIALQIVPGADVRVDERICSLLEADKILTLADGGRYLLLELPHEILIDIQPLIEDLTSMGIAAIISHPERHSGLLQEPDILLKWLESSAYLQVTAGSLLGDFGSATQKFSWQMLGSGWISCIATDSHNLDGRRPRMKAAYERISMEFSEAFARLVCIENPLRILKGKDLAVTSAKTKVYGDGREQKPF